MALDRNAYMREYRKRRPGMQTAILRRMRDRNPERFAATRAAAGSNQYVKRHGWSGRITTDDVLAVWARDPTCIACGVGRGLDHIVPLKAGGEHHRENLQTMCPSCNSRKNVATQPRGYRGRLAKRPSDYS